MKRLRLFMANVARWTLNSPANTPPLGILCLAAYLRERFDLDLYLVDQRVERCGADELVRQAVAFEPDVVGLGTLTSSAQMLREVSSKLRQALPRTLIVLGGPHVSAFRASAMENTGADAAVVGEGELAFEQILRAHLDGGDFSHTPGLIWRDAAGEVITNPGAMPLIEDLDSLPFPAYDLIDPRKYWRSRSMAPLAPRRYIALLSSRGCPYQCIYCHQIFGKRFRAQSPERIVEEIEHYQRTFGVNEVEFVDDIFNQDTSRVLEFCRLVKQRDLKLKIVFPNAIRGDRLSEETVDALVGAGLYFSCCALESGSPRIQKAMGKRLNIPRFLEGVALLVDRGVFTHGYTMLGFPTETEEEIRQTIDVACRSRLHTATFFTVTPYPNTELYAQVMKTHPEKLANVNYEDADYTGIAMNLSAASDEVLFAYQRMAWRRFFFNPARIMRVLRDYPRPLSLAYYLPMFSLRLTKGLFRGQGSSLSTSFQKHTDV